jgi:hypothetical protein
VSFHANKSTYIALCVKHALPQSRFHRAVGSWAATGKPTFTGVYFGCISDGWSSVCLIFPIILAVLLLNTNAGAHKRSMLATLVIADAGFGPHYGNDP